MGGNESVSYVSSLAHFRGRKNATVVLSWRACVRVCMCTYLLHHRPQESPNARAPWTRRKGLVRILQFSVQTILRLLRGALDSMGPRRRRRCVGPAPFAVVLFWERLLDNVVVG